MRASFGLIGLFIVGLIIHLSSCFVPVKKYQELKLVKEYYEAEADAADSMSNEQRRAVAEYRKLEAELKAAYREIDQLAATNMTLDRAYKDLSKRYNETVGNNQQVVSNYSYEKQAYEQRLAEQQIELDRKNQELQAREAAIQQREAQLGMMQSDVDNLRSQLNNQPQPYNTYDLQRMQNRVYQNLQTARPTDFNVYSRNGRVYVSFRNQLEMMVQ